MSSSGRAGLRARVVLSLCLSIFITHPLLVSFVGKTLDARMEQDFTQTRAALETKYAAKLESLERDAARLNEILNTDRARVTALSPRNVAMRRFQEAESSPR